MHARNRACSRLASAVTAVLTVSLAALCPAIAAGNDSVDYSGYMHWNATEYLGSAYATVIEGNYAYIAHTTLGLKVADITDPDDPQEVGALGGTTINGRYVALADTFAYVADYDYGVRVVSIADPASPALIGGIALVGRPAGLALDGGYLYVAARSGGLYVLSLAIPDQPAQVGHITVGSTPARVVVEDSVAYVIDETVGDVYSIDIGDPDNPQVLDSLPLEDNLYGLVKAGDYLYVSGGLWLYVVDTSDPSALLPGSPASLLALGGDVAEAGGRVYVADGQYSLYRYDASSPSAPVTSDSTFVGYGYAMGLDVAGGYCYIASSYGLKVIDNADAEVLKPLATVPGAIEAVAAFGDHYAFGVGDNGPCWTYDVSNPLSPLVIGSVPVRRGQRAGTVTSFFDLLGKSQGMMTQWTLGLAGGLYGIDVIDLADPSSPSARGFLSTDGVVDLAAKGRYVYVAGYYLAGYPPQRYSCLDVIDLADPAAPVQVARRYLYDVRAIAVCGDYAYIGDANRILIFDISDPTAPELADSVVSADDVTAIVVEGGKAYAGYKVAPPGPYRYYLQIFDATDAVALEPLGALAMGTVFDVDPVGDYAYVSTVQEAFVVCDCSDLLNPSIIGALYTPIHLDGAALAGDCFLLAGTGGLQVAPLHGAAQSAVGTDRDDKGSDVRPGCAPFTVTPNPVRGSATVAFAVGRDGHVQLSVYDVAGRKVASLVNKSLAAGRHVAGFDASGLPPGIYFAALETPGQRLAKKLVVVR